MTHLEGGPAATSTLTLSPAERSILRAALGLRDGSPPLPRLASHSRIHYAPTPAEVPICEVLRSHGCLARAARLDTTPAAVRPCYIVTDAGHRALIASESA